MPAFRTAFQGYSVKFSPFEEDKLAVATSQNFGIIGNGKQYVLQMTPGGLVEARCFDTADGLYDCAWAEGNDRLLASACGDGSVKLWDVGAPAGANPLRSLREHAHEVYCLAWNPHAAARDAFLSGSWDDTLRLWSVDAPRALRAFEGHTYCVYAAAWNPAAPDVFLSASGDCTAKVWDVRARAPALSLRAHEAEVLAADWCKYDDAVLATGSVDKSVRVWDVRAPARELARLLGHGYAVRRVAWSPHAATLLASASYDMTVRLWDHAAPADPLRAVWDHHTEFAVGLDWSALAEGAIASCGWDGGVHVWDARGAPG